MASRLFTYEEKMEIANYLAEASKNLQEVLVLLSYYNYDSDNTRYKNLPTLSEISNLKTLIGYIQYNILHDQVILYKKLEEEINNE